MEDFAGVHHNMRQAAVSYCEGRNDGEGNTFINALAFGKEYVDSYLHWESGDKQNAFISLQDFYAQYAETYISFTRITNMETQI